MNNRYPNLFYAFFNVLGQKLIDGSLSNSMNTISVEGFAEGVYFLYLLDKDSDSSITKKIVIDR